jgi:23S rRNA (adenine2503-C2)-methyltransferase
MTPLVEMLPAALERKRGILELSPQELAAWLQEHGQPALRARQLRRWIVSVGAESFEQMTDLPKDLRQQLSAEFVPLATRIDQHQRAADDTHKLLLELRDGRRVECVLIQQDGRRTACLSTQVGCGMGCVFCASGLGGLDRNLAAGEILEQLLQLRSLPAPAGHPVGRLTHIVVMGMGEPLANFDALLEVLEAASARDGLGIGARHITISTVGLPAKIRKLADLGKQYHLAVSLHAPTDALRSQIVATHAKAGLAAILEAADYFHQKTGRQVTFEYVLLGGINDDVTHAR